MAEIKELSEVLDAVSVLAVAAKKVMKDGKVDFSDLAVLKELGEQIPVLVAAFDGISAVGEEVKDIDSMEAVALIEKMYGIVKKVQAV